MNKKIIIGLIVAILVAGGVFAGLSLKKEKKAEKPEAPKVSADINPLTGMKWKKNWALSTLSAASLFLCWDFSF